MAKGYWAAEKVLWSHHTDSANTAVVATLTPAASDEYICIDQVILTFSGGTPASCTIIISDGTTRFSADVNSVGPHNFPFVVPIIGTKGATVTVTVAAGGSGVIAKLNIGRRV